MKLNGYVCAGTCYRATIFPISCQVSKIDFYNTIYVHGGSKHINEVISGMLETSVDVYVGSFISI